MGGKRKGRLFQTVYVLPHTVRAVVLEIGSAGSVSLISNIHRKSGHPVSLISNLESPKTFLRHTRAVKSRSRSSANQGQGVALGCEGSEGEAQQGDPTSCESMHYAQPGSWAQARPRGEARRESSVCRRVPNAENFFARLWRTVSLISNID